MRSVSSIVCSVTNALAVTSVPSVAVRPYSTFEVDGSSVLHVIVAWPSAFGAAATWVMSGAVASVA